MLGAALRWVAGVGVAVTLAGAAGLTPQEIRGRTLYRKGLLASGTPVTAYLAGRTEVKGDVVPCAGCHGLDGRGRAEGGVTPSSVRWQDLVRPYEVTAPTGRKHGPYTERSLVSAIALGLDPAGNTLHAVMPRFALPRPDADDLIAYLKKLAGDYDPGVTDDRIRIGTLLPAEKSFPGMAQTVRAALRAVFDDVNRAGGLYGRRIDLVLGELPEQRSDAGAAYAKFLESENVFALVSSFLAGVEDQATEAIAAQKIPVIGGQTLLPLTSSSVFLLDGGLPAQAEALAAFGAKRYGPETAPAMVASGDRLSQAALHSAEAQWPNAKQVRLESAANAGAVATELKAAKTGVVLALLPSAELRALLGEAQRIGFSPAYLIPSAFTSATILGDLTAAGGPVFAASSFLPTDVTSEGQAEYQRLAAEAQLPAKGFASQFAAMCEARILIEGLKRAGRELSRERLVEALEGIYDFPAGYRQAVSFGPNRRVGIPQVHIVTVEKTGALREVTER